MLLCDLHQEFVACFARSRDKRCTECISSYLVSPLSDSGNVATGDLQLLPVQIQIQIRTCRARLTDCPGALTKCQKAMRNR